MNSFFVFLCLIPIGICMFGTQSVAVKGRLMCGNHPASNVRIKLWDEDRGPDPDDLLDQGYSDVNGDFHLQGHTIEASPIDPVFKVYHECNDGIIPGYRKVKWGLPDKYITQGAEPKIVADLGIINLELEYMDEERTLLLS